MNYWVLILWITFTAADGGGMTKVEIAFDPGNRAFCEQTLHTIKKDMLLNGFGKGEDMYYPTKVEGKCEMRPY